MGGRHPQSRHFITAQEPVYRTGSQSYRERLLCAQGSPPALLSTQGLREGTGTEMTLVGVSHRPLLGFISRAVHRWERAGCMCHVELSCGPSNELTAILLCHSDQA